MPFPTLQELQAKALLLRDGGADCDSNMGDAEVGENEEIDEHGLQMSDAESSHVVTSAADGTRTKTKAPFV